MLARPSLSTRVWAILGAALLLSLGLATVAVACDDCITVIDIPAWDEPVTVTDAPAWDEPVTIQVPAWFEDTTLDHPAVWVAPVPARTVQHHDLVTPAYTVNGVTVIPAHDDPYDVWVSSFIIDYQWVDTSHYVSVWVDTSWDESYEYWQTVWCWDGDGYYDCGYTATGWLHHSSGYWDQVWVSSGYEQQVRIDTSHTETRYTHVPEQIIPYSYIVPAVYDDWIETIAGVPGYWIPAWSEPMYIYHPATTRTDVIHHAALTHLTTVHHIAVGHLQRLGAGSTQSAQGAPPAAGGSGSSAAIVTEPVRIPIVTTLSLVDRPAYTETRTIVDQPAWDEVQTIIDAPATTTTRTVTDSPARTVQHHDLVTAATSTQVQVLVTPARDETTSIWVPETTTRLNTTSGQVISTFVPDQYGLVWYPQTCYWDWDDDGHRYWTCDGGFYYNALITPAHWETSWHQGQYVYTNTRDCDEMADGRIVCYGGWQWIWNDGPFWETVDTSHYVYTATHYDAVYRTDTVTTPAAYNDWTESIPAVTHQETVPVPAVTHTVTIHHNAVTHVEFVAVAAVTHTQSLSLDAVVKPDSGPGGSSDNDLADFAALMGLVAIAGAGRLGTTRAVLRQTLAQWTASGRSVPAGIACAATDDQATDAEVDCELDAALSRGRAQLSTSDPALNFLDDGGAVSDETALPSALPAELASGSGFVEFAAGVFGGPLGGLLQPLWDGMAGAAKALGRYLANGLADALRDLDNPNWFVKLSAMLVLVPAAIAVAATTVGAGLAIRALVAVLLQALQMLAAARTLLQGGLFALLSVWNKIQSWLQSLVRRLQGQTSIVTRAIDADAALLASRTITTMQQLESEVAGSQPVLIIGENGGVQRVANLVNQLKSLNPNVMTYDWQTMGTRTADRAQQLLQNRLWIQDAIAKGYKIISIGRAPGATSASEFFTAELDEIVKAAYPNFIQYVVGP